MKKVFSIILALVMIMPMVSSAEDFVREREYTNGYFSDVSENDWFYEGVAGAYSYGFAEGNGEGCFSPYGLVSIAEAIVFACRLNGQYNGEVPVSENKSGKWYTPWVNYAEENAIIEKEEFSGKYEKAATRAQVAYILGNALPFNEFENINTHISSIADMASTDAFYNEVIMLYRAGVLMGKDDKGNFAPTENITRGEIATVIYRIANKSVRIKTDGNKVTNISQDKIYNAEQISEFASGAVFLIGVYNSKGELYATGSGFFTDEDGTAITNYHVIEDAASAKILTAEGETFEVELLLGCHKEKDIAIIKVKGENFKAVKLGDSSQIKNGQEIFCIGSPQGLDNTISEGLVSNVSREIEGRKYIQISAPISNGSSGGAVFTNKGEVIGITSAGLTNGQNLNLAIPINDIYTVEQNVNKPLGEYFGKNQNGTGGEANNYGEAFYEGTSLPMYEYITGRAAVEKEEDEDSVIYVYEFVQFEFMVYLNIIQTLGWKNVKNEVSGTLKLITMTQIHSRETVIIGYDYSLGVAYVAVPKY